MGLYDRDYLRDDEPPRGFNLGAGPQSMVARLVIVNVAIYVIDLFTQHALGNLLTLRSDALTEPWTLWRVLTYAFAHDPHNINHILFNMLGLWMFGQPIEQRYGGKEFLRIYLVAAVLGGVVWLVAQQFRGFPSTVLGASGAVNAIVILFAMNYPNATLMLMFILPMKAWMAAILFVLLDMFGIGDNVAHEVHLAGAAFGFAYYRLHWNLNRIGLPGWASQVLSRRPKLRVFEPPDPAEVEARVDAILKKISEQGEASLTKAERKTLEDASRRYQRQRKS